jgi:hypothetical protein
MLQLDSRGSLAILRHVLVLHRDAVSRRDDVRQMASTASNVGLNTCKDVLWLCSQANWTAFQPALVTYFAQAAPLVSRSLGNALR